MRTMYCLASVLYDNGHSEEAIRTMQELIELENKELGEDSEETRASLATLCRMLQVWPLAHRTQSGMVGGEVRRCGMLARRTES